jgi:hypothetical protein
VREERYNFSTQFYTIPTLPNRRFALVAQKILLTMTKKCLEPYGTTEFGISNPIPSRGHITSRYTSQTQQDGGWLSDGGHGIITKYLPDGEAEFS